MIGERRRCAEDLRDAEKKFADEKRALLLAHEDRLQSFSEESVQTLAKERLKHAEEVEEITKNHRDECNALERAFRERSGKDREDKEREMEREVTERAEKIRLEEKEEFKRKLELVTARFGKEALEQEKNFLAKLEQEKKVGKKNPGEAGAGEEGRQGTRKKIPGEAGAGEDTLEQEKNFLAKLEQEKEVGAVVRQS